MDKLSQKKVGKGPLVGEVGFTSFLLVKRECEQGETSTPEYAGGRAAKGKASGHEETQGPQEEASAGRGDGGQGRGADSQNERVDSQWSLLPSLCSSIAKKEIIGSSVFSFRPTKTKTKTQL